MLRTKTPRGFTDNKKGGTRRPLPIYTGTQYRLYTNAPVP